MRGRQVWILRGVVPALMGMLVAGWFCFQPSPWSPPPRVGLLTLLRATETSFMHSTPGQESKIHALVPRLLALADGFENLECAAFIAWREYLSDVQTNLVTRGRARQDEVGNPGIDGLPGANFLHRISGLTADGVSQLEEDGNAGLALLLADEDALRADGLMRHIQENQPEYRPIDVAAMALSRVRRGDIELDELRGLLGSVEKTRPSSRSDSLAVALAGLALARSPGGLSEGLELLERTGSVLCNPVQLSLFQVKREPAARDHFCDFGLLGDLALIIRRIVADGVAMCAADFSADAPGLSEAAWFYGQTFGFRRIAEYLPPSVYCRELLVEKARYQGWPVWAWLAAAHLLVENTGAYATMSESLQVWRGEGWAQELLAFPDSLACQSMLADLVSGTPPATTTCAALWDWFNNTLPRAGDRVRVVRSSPATMLFILTSALDWTRRLRTPEGGGWGRRQAILEDQLTKQVDLGSGSAFRFLLATTDVYEAWSGDRRRRMTFSRAFDPLKDIQMLWPLATADKEGEGAPEELEILRAVPGLNCARDVLSITASRSEEDGHIQRR